MKVLVIGAGYVGVCTALSLASEECTVTVIDSNPDRVEKLSRGVPPFYEAGLENELVIALLHNYIHFELNLDLSKLNFSFDATFVCVGTPALESGLADLSAVKVAIDLACKATDTSGAIFVRSSCPPGSMPYLSRDVPSNFTNRIYVYPEFLREGCAIQDMKNPDRIVIGGIEVLEDELANRLFPTDVPIIFTTPYSAAMIKYANNSLLATLISFGNAIAEICEQSEEDWDMPSILRGLFLDRRWTRSGEKMLPSIVSYLVPGIGYGGSCLPKDVRALKMTSQEGSESRALLGAIDFLNLNRTKNYLNYLIQENAQILDGDILVVGISFKEGSDDIRGSTALKLVQELCGRIKSGRLYWLDSFVEFTGDKEIDSLKIDFNSIENFKVIPKTVIFTSNDWPMIEKVSNQLASSNTKFVFARYQDSLSSVLLG
jgi:nucleotide sugar dehydrogenase